MRVPAVDPKREKLILHFEKKLIYFQRIPPHRRENEAADEGEAACRAILADLRANGRAESTSTVRRLTLNEWLDEIDEVASDENG